MSILEVSNGGARANGCGMTRTVCDLPIKTFSAGREHSGLGLTQLQLHAPSYSYMFYSYAIAHKHLQAQVQVLFMPCFHFFYW